MADCKVESWRELLRSGPFLMGVQVFPVKNLILFISHLQCVLCTAILSLYGHTNQLYFFKRKPQTESMKKKKIILYGSFF